MAHSPFSLARSLVLAFAVGSTVTLAGCGAVIVGGAAATTAMVATDRRTAGEQVEDQAIELKTASEMTRVFGERARVNATSYAGVVLLTGDVPNAQDKAEAERLTAGVEKVRRVINELRVGDITPLSVRTNDTWLTSKVRTALINTKDLPSLAFVVTTERGVVYMLGRVTETEGQRAAKAASMVSGVNKVVKLFEIVSPESLASPAQQSQQEQQAAPSSSVPETSSGPVQTMPVQ
jgi:osmotically-inducible protein OsmY